MLKIIYTLLLIVIYNMAQGKIIPVGETVITLNGTWKLVKDPYNKGEREKWYEKEGVFRQGEDITVPSNWDVTNDRAGYKGKVWYYTSFQRPRSHGGPVLLSFGEVSMSYAVYLNGIKVATVLCGNYEEEFNIDKYLKEGNNTLVVMVDNSLKWGAYYNWGGIRRPVKLVLRHQLSIESQQVIATPDLTARTARVRTAIKIYNAGSQEQTISLAYAIAFEGSPAGKEVLQTIRLNANERRQIFLDETLDSSRLHLWDFDHPHLYTSQAKLVSNGRTVYERRERFGIRKIEIRQQQFFLNGEPVRMTGYNWVADDRTTGNTLPAFRFKEDIDLMKAAGANFARLSHRPLPADVMDYLDEKGMLIIAEFNNWPCFMTAASPEPRLFAKKLIEQNFNHPCIAGWSIGNENGNLQEFPHVNAYVSSMIQYIKSSLDSTRLVAYVSHTADFQDNDAVQFCDVVFINKYANYAKAVDVLAKRYPDKAIFMTEYGGHGANLIYDTPDHSLFRSLMVDGLGKQKHFFGYALWTFNDYRSEYQAPNPNTTTPLHQNRQWGIVDVYRNKKRSYRQMQNFYAPVADLQVKCEKDDHGGMKTSIELQPRRTDDIPAFALKGYRLIWQLINKEEKTINLGSVELPDIFPGDPVFQQKLSLGPDAAAAALLKVSLLTPTGYIVKDSTLFFTVPPPPSAQLLHGDKQIRILFDRNIFSNEYRLYCEKEGVVKCIDTTTDHYLQSENLVVGTPYKFWMTAINEQGESSPSNVFYFTPQAGYTVLPPVIWLSEPADHGFYTGMSYHYTDVHYEIRYGTAIKDTTSWHSIISNQFGMMQVPGLDNGMPYYYQLRRTTAFNAIPSAWSELKKIVPDKYHHYGNGKILGFKQEGENLLISYIPPKNASGYRVNLHTSGGKHINRLINQSIPEIIYLPGVTDDKVTSIEVQPVW